MKTMANRIPLIRRINFLQISSRRRELEENCVPYSIPFCVTKVPQRRASNPNNLPITPTYTTIFTSLSRLIQLFANQPEPEVSQIRVIFVGATSAHIHQIIQHASASTPDGSSSKKRSWDIAVSSTTAFQSVSIAISSNVGLVTRL